MLSVIVPIYNVEQYLPKCIESIVNQTYKELEILLIDDGSTDSCPLICDKYAKEDSRVKVLHKKNEGLVRARKTGLDSATGEYVAFVDGDDWIDIDMYSKLLEVMEMSNADFLDSGYICEIEGDFRIERKRNCIYELNSYVRHRIFGTLINLDDFIKISPSIWSKIFKTELIKKSYAKVPDNMQHGEDAISLIYCLLNASKMLQVEDAFYHYIYREESMSHLKSASYLRKEFVLWNQCGEIILEHDKLINQQDIDKFLFQKFYSAFGYLLTQEFDVIQYYAFPYIELLFDKKIVIYGAGKVGKDYLTQIAKYEQCEIICWADRNYENIHLNYRKVIGVKHFLNKTYDIVLLAVEQKRIADEIKQFLLEQGVLESKIVWYKPKTLV